MVYGPGFRFSGLGFRVQASTPVTVISRGCGEIRHLQDADKGGRKGKEAGKGRGGVGWREPPNWRHHTNHARS